MENPSVVTIKLLDKEYKISCASSESALLLQAAGILDTQMQNMRLKNANMGPERIAIMCALDAHYQALQLKNPSSEIPASTAHKIQALNTFIEGVLKNEAASFNASAVQEETV